jgi:WD40 repeat protein
VVLSEIKEGKLVLKYRLAGHTDEVRSLAFSPGGDTLVSGARDGFVRLWDSAQGKHLQTLHPNLGVVYAVAVSPDSRWLAVGGGDWTKSGAVKIYDFAQRKQVALLGGYPSFVHSLSFTSDSKRIATGGGDKTVRIWQMPGGTDSPAEIIEISTAERLFSGKNSSGHSIAVSKDGSHILVGHHSSGVSLWHISGGDEIRQFTGPEQAIHSVMFWPDGQHVLAASEDATIRLWNLETGEEVRQFQGHTGRIDSLALSRDGSLLLSGSADYGMERDRSIRLWNAATGEEVRRFREVTRDTRELVFSADAAKAYGAGVQSSSIIEWDVASGQPVHRFREMPTNPLSLAVSPDGSLLAAGYAAREPHEASWHDPENCVVRLWDLTTRAVVRELRGHSGPVGDVTFTPDGRFLLSTATSEHDAAGRFVPSGEQTVRVWNVSTGSELARYQTHERVIQVAACPDGKSFLTVGESIRLWRLPESAWPKAEEP